jgi:hypothetical protein
MMNAVRTGNEPQLQYLLQLGKRLLSLRGSLEKRRLMLPGAHEKEAKPW